MREVPGRLGLVHGQGVHDVLEVLLDGAHQGAVAGSDAITTTRLLLLLVVLVLVVPV